MPDQIRPSTREFVMQHVQEARRQEVEEAFRREELQLQAQREERDHALALATLRARQARVAAAVLVALLLGGGALWFGSSFSADLWGASVQVGE